AVGEWFHQERGAILLSFTNITSAGMAKQVAWQLRQAIQ
ncbi:GntR family transcriptional regulator, partial [Salmonella enterica subsp. enterica serovar Choleraesuis str. 0006]